MNNTMMKKLTVAFVAGSLLVSGCSTVNNMNRTQKGAAVGTAGGAVAGAVVGKVAGNTAIGAILGAVVGGTAGALIGNKMDKQAREIQTKVPDATVERVGEGINVTFSSGVLFGLNKADVNVSAQSNLNELAKILNEYPDTYVRVEGHTDNTGTHAYNEGLSERRAEAVASYLKQQGINDARIQTAWYAETQPKFPNDTDENRAKNRRVEFAIYANEKMKAEATKQQ